MYKELIYIVEDDANIREIMQYALKNSGYQADGFENGRDFLARIRQDTILPSLILLDIMLPGEDGLEILSQIRKTPKTADIPVIMVTAKNSELDKVKGLDTGADDYVTKPFGVMELVSRVRALLRRTKQTEGPRQLSYSGILLDDEKHAVYIGPDKIPIELTYKEFELLKYLMNNRGYVLSRDKIMDRVWGLSYEG